MADGGKGKQLRADIVIGGKLDGSFSALGAAIQSLGGQVSQVSDKLISFGKESVGEYVKFEDAMLDARVAMKTQYDSTNQLDKDMKSLTEHALQWASSTRFTTDDVASAISNAAHAGWDYEQIMQGIPNAMEVAMAGGMDLSKSLDYMVKITNAAGLSFEDLGTFTDMWTFAANSSATTIPEMGNAMVKMGASMQFVKGDMVGLTTMLATLADQGTVGEQAGTLLRNSLFRLIAPTEKAAKTMDGFKLTEEELNEIYGEGAENTEAVVNQLKELGFSVYDAQGNLKPFLEIFEDLNTVTSQMTDEQRLQALAAIFPTKTLAGALALLKGAQDGWNGLDDAIRNTSEGYGEFAMETMESGLGGALRRLDSAWQALETRVGGSLKDDVGTVAGFLTNVVNSVNNMDPAVFDAVVAGLETVAAAGPGLLIAGGAIKGLGMIASTGTMGQLILASIAIASLGEALQKYNEAMYENAFGDLSIDQDSFAQYVKGIGDEFATAHESIDKYNEAVGKAIETYTMNTSDLKEGLISQMLTESTLTQEDIDSYMKMGENIGKALISGINSAYSSVEESIAMVGGFENPEDAAGGSGFWAELMSIINDGYNKAIQRANELSGELRSALTSAFADGQLSEAELSGIQGIMDQMNEVMSQETQAINEAASEVALRKAQNLGLEGYRQIDETLKEEESKAEESIYDDYRRAMETVSRDMIQQGYSEEYRREMLGKMWDGGTPDNITDGYEGMLYQNRAYYSDTRMRAARTALSGSDVNGVYEAAYDAADYYLNGEINSDAARESLVKLNSFGNEDIAKTVQFLSEVVNSFGGVEEMGNLAQFYQQMGNTQTANDMLQMMTAYTMLGGGIMRDNQTFNWGEYWGESLAGFQRQQEYYPQSGSTDTTVNADTSGAEGAIEQLGDTQITAQVDGDTSGLESSISAEDGQSITVNVNGDTSQAAAAINALNNQTIHVKVVADTSGLNTRATKMTGGTNVFALGGRANEPSIFGEAGPEWAIPEQHTERTAELLSKAAAASGFTWGELLSRNGGLNAGSGRESTLVYSPVIYAGDATDVEAKLREDKERLEKWYRDMQIRDSVEAYA